MSAPATVGDGDLPLLRFAGGLVGFPDAHSFALVPLGEPGDGLFRMRCLDYDLEFVVVAPPVFFPDYEPVIDDDTVARLDLGNPDDAVTLVLVTVADPIESSTANLMAPVVVNVRSREAAQVVLDVTQPLRRTLVAV